MRIHQRMQNKNAITSIAASPTSPYMINSSILTLSPHLSRTFLTVHTNRLEQNYRNGAIYHAQ
jgi:hypothetical protein